MQYFYLVVVLTDVLKSKVSLQLKKAEKHYHAVCGKYPKEVILLVKQPITTTGTWEVVKTFNV